MNEKKEDPKVKAKRPPFLFPFPSDRKAHLREKRVSLREKIIKESGVKGRTKFFYQKPDYLSGS